MRPPFSCKQSLTVLLKFYCIVSSCIPSTEDLNLRTDQVKAQTLLDRLPVSKTAGQMLFVRCWVPKRADVSLVPSEVRKQHVLPNRRKWTQRAPIFPSVSYPPERRKAYAPNPNPIPAA